MKWLTRKNEKSYTAPVDTARGWWPWTIKEWNTGYWQRNIEYKRVDVLCYHAVFACISLIAGDISKLRPKIVREDSNGIWKDIPYEKYGVITRPNSYQNTIQFFESWLLSKLIRGNAYIYKQKAANGTITEMHVLHPDRVLPLVTDDGQVFYQLSQDNLSGIDPEGITIPASEIIHDRFNCFFHPLVGLSPLFASGLPAYMGLKALENSAKLFANGSRPSGILTIPEAITKEHAGELSEQWEARYGGDNYGKTAILGGDLKYQPLSMNSEETEIVAQLRMTAEMVCSTFHVPPYKIGVGEMPSYNNVEALNLEYYNSALQRLIEDIELCIHHGFDMSEKTALEFDIDGLLRMDTKSQIETLGMAVDKAIYAPNEARKRVNVSPVEGGDVPLLQQQMWPINILAKRPVEELVGQTQQAPEDPEKDLTAFVMKLGNRLKGINYDA